MPQDQSKQDPQADPSKQDSQPSASSPKKLKINKSLCTECGTCAATFPDLFGYDEEQKVQVKPDADFSNQDLDSIKNICPAGAIEEA